jgi:excisionase family DNA binding protein
LADYARRIRLTKDEIMGLLAAIGNSLTGDDDDEAGIADPATIRAAYRGQKNLRRMLHDLPPEPPDETRALSRAEVATTMRVSERTVSRWIERGILVGVRVGRRLVILRSDLDTLIENGTERGPT